MAVKKSDEHRVCGSDSCCLAWLCWSLDAHWQIALQFKIDCASSGVLSFWPFEYVLHCWGYILSGNTMYESLAFVLVPEYVL